jgi:hypothetical protein
MQSHSWRTRLAAYGLSLFALAVVASPMFAVSPRDSFPLSTYPMFAHTRPRIVDIDHVVAVDGDGQRRVVPPAIVSRGEVLQSKAIIDGAVSRGRRASAALCREIAARLADDADWSATRLLEVRRDRFDVLGYFSGAREPLESRVHARCRVRKSR